MAETLSQQEFQRFSLKIDEMIVRSGFRGFFVLFRNTSISLCFNFKLLSYTVEDLMTAVSVIPTTIRDIEWVAELEAKLFTGIDVIPVELLEEWYQSNPTGFFIIKTEDGQRVGHIDVLPLRPKTLDLLLEGTLIERQIRGDELYSIEEKDAIKDLYIECIAICVLGPTRAIARHSLLSSFASIFNNMGSLDTLEKVYATAATKAGEQFLTNLGFKVARRGEERQDGHPILVVDAKVLLENIDHICESRLVKIKQ